MVGKVQTIQSIEGNFYVVGFGRLSVVITSPTTLNCSKQQGAMLQIGASALALDVLRQLGPFVRLRNAHSNFTEPVLAPVLAR